MKSTIVLCILLILTYYSFSQTNKYFGGPGGGWYSDITHIPEDVLDAYFLHGIEIERSSSERSSLVSGLYYATLPMEHTRLSYDENSSGSKMNIVSTDLHSIIIPVGIKFYPLQGKIFRPFLYADVKNRFDIYVKETSYYRDPLAESEQLDYAGTVLRWHDALFSIAGGLDVDIDDRFRLSSKLLFGVLEFNGPYRKRGASQMITEGTLLEKPFYELFNKAGLQFSALINLNQLGGGKSK